MRVGTIHSNLRRTNLMGPSTHPLGQPPRRSSLWRPSTVRQLVSRPRMQPLAPSPLLTPNGGCAAQDLDLLNSLRTGNRLLKRAERSRLTITSRGRASLPIDLIRNAQRDRKATISL